MLAKKLMLCALLLLPKTSYAQDYEPTRGDLCAAAPFIVGGTLGLLFCEAFPEVYIWYLQKTDQMHDNLTDKQKAEIRAIMKEAGHQSPQTVKLFSCPSKYSVFTSTINSMAVPEDLLQSGDMGLLRDSVGYATRNIVNNDFRRVSLIAITIPVLAHLLAKQTDTRAINSPITKFLASLYLLCAYSRHTVKQADLETAKLLNCAKDSIRFFNLEMEAAKKNPQSKWPLWKKAYHLPWQIFATHPSDKKRIKYLKKLLESEKMD